MNALSAGMAREEPAGISEFAAADGLEVEQELQQLREEKKLKFQELTERFIKEIITREDVISKRAFLESGPKDLKECLEQAVRATSQAKLGEKRISLAKQRIIKAARDLFAEAAAEFEWREGSLSSQAFEGEDYNVTFRQPLFRGGALWNTLKQEQATLQAAEAEYEDIVSDLVYTVSESYFETLRAKQKWEDAKDILKTADHIRDITRKKYEKGLISEIENLNVESQQSQIAHNVEQAYQDYELAFLDLQTSLSLNVDDRVELVPYYEYQDIIRYAKKAFTEKGEQAEMRILGDTELGKPLEHYLDLAYEHRPDLKQQVNRVRSNIMATRAARGKLLPRVDLVMQFGELGEAFTDTVPPDQIPHTPEWQLTMEASWNLAGNTVKYTYDNDQNAPSVSQFQGGSGTSTKRNNFSVALLNNLEENFKVTESEIEMMDQFVRLEESEQEMIREVKEAYFNYRRAEIQLESQIKQLLYREKVAKLNKHKLSTLEVEDSEYLGSELDLFDERDRFHKAMADYFIARVGLNQAVGLQDLMPISKWESEPGNE